VRNLATSSAAAAQISAQTPTVERGLASDQYPVRPQELRPMEEVLAHPAVKIRGLGQTPPQRRLVQASMPSLACRHPRLRPHWAAKAQVRAWGRELASASEREPANKTCGRIRLRNQRTAVLKTQTRPDGTDQVQKSATVQKLELVQRQEPALKPALAPKLELVRKPGVEPEKAGTKVLAAVGTRLDVLELETEAADINSPPFVSWQS